MWAVSWELRSGSRVAVNAMRVESGDHARSPTVNLSPEVKLSALGRCFASLGISSGTETANILLHRVIGAYDFEVAVLVFTIFGGLAVCRLRKIGDCFSIRRPSEIYDA